MVRASWIGRLLKAIFGLALILWLSYAILLAWIWSGRAEVTINSAALSETRAATVFNAGSKIIIYSLDGEGIRHGLLPAANGTAIARLNGEPAPTIVAVHTQSNRDVDLRPARVEPAYWRPDIKGRSHLFDKFLIAELRANIERRFGAPRKRYLFGHSLGGFYAIDLLTRRSDYGFDGLFAFSPTFSHDMSLLRRFGVACANGNQLYANIGLESERDTDVFNKAEAEFKKIEVCEKRVELRRHPAMIHQIVMLTGQVAAFNRIYSRP
jgi:predicted alpha/beta superfamily hydrolase